MIRLLICLLALASTAEAQWRRSTRLVPVGTSYASDQRQEASGVDAVQTVQWQPHETGDWRNCYEACVRIQQGNTFGSGGVFHVDQQAVWILTNAHVVGIAQAVGVEFFKRGYKSSQLQGTVYYRQYVPQGDVDMAIVVVPRSYFGNEPPAYLPIGRDPQPGEQIITTGCPRADWPAMWSGHVVEIRGNIVYFTPGPKTLPDGGNMMSGRSGSVLVNADATEIVGLIAWSSQRHGMAQRISHVVRSAVAETQQCGPFGCQRPAPPPQQPPMQPFGGQGPWPQLPPEGGSGGASQAAITELRERIASLERDRSQAVQEWAKLRALAQKVEEDLPAIKQWVEQSGDEQLREATAYAEKLITGTNKQIERLEGEVEKAAGVKGWAQEQLGDLRADLKAYAAELASTQNVIDLVQQYRAHREDSGVAESIKLTLADAVGQIRTDLRQYGQDKVVGAKEQAIEDIPALAIKWLPWPIATALSVAMWAFKRRRGGGSKDQDE